MSSLIPYNDRTLDLEGSRAGMAGDSIDYKALFDRMPVPRFVVRPVGAGIYRFVEANARAAQWLGRSTTKISDRRIEDILDEDFSRCLIQAFESCIRARRTVTVQGPPNFPGGMRVHHLVVSPIVQQDGRVEMIDVMAQPDASDQSSVQRERDDALSLLSSIFDVSEVGIVVTDHHRRIVKVNDSFCRIYGWSRDALIGMDCTDIITPDERERAVKNHTFFNKTGERGSGEMKLIRKDGGIANTLFTSAMLELSHRRRFQVTTVMDITLRKQMEVSLRLAKEQADTANKAKSAFLANMSHELRTPLNAVIGFSEMMMKEVFGKLGSPKYAEYLGDIHSSARHLLEIINEVLDMSKIEAGRVELDEHETDLRQLFESVRRMIVARAGEMDLSVTLRVDPDVPYLYVDPRLTRQILINLATNAVKFSNRGGRIDLHASIGPDGGVRIVVSDNGIGIPRDRIKLAMEPFGQVSDSVVVRGMQGTGLGLPLARAMAELHGGGLTLESEQGKGTIVTIFFPASRSVYRLPETGTMQARPEQVSAPLPVSVSATSAE